MRFSAKPHPSILVWVWLDLDRKRMASSENKRMAIIESVDSISRDGPDVT